MIFCKLKLKFVNINNINKKKFNLNLYKHFFSFLKDNTIYYNIIY